MNLYEFRYALDNAKTHEELETLLTDVVSINMKRISDISRILDKVDYELEGYYKFK